jgi:DNA-binding response OmpR family regulator
MGSAYRLSGRSFLVVEDEPLISLEMTAIFEGAGAKVLPARTLAEAVRLIGQDSVSAAVLDFGLGGESVSTLCGNLRERGIPFMFYSGHGHVQASYPESVVVEKPASGATLLAAMADLVGRRAAEPAHATAS